MDKIKRDLEQLNLLSDIANTTIIADLESKLPYEVKRDWIKLVSSKECIDMTPSEIFHKLLEFFENYKQNIIIKIFVLQSHFAGLVLSLVLCAGCILP